MKKKWICTVCGYVHEGEKPPEICPICKQPKDKFVEQIESEEERANFEEECIVISNRNVSTFIKELKLQLSENNTLDFKPGSYVHLHIPPFDIHFKDMDIDKRFHSEWDKYKVWDLKGKNEEDTFRVYSMANYPAEGNIITLNIRVATPPIDRETGTWKTDVKPGIGSTYAFSLKPGDKIKVSGPFGKFHIQETNSEMIYVGGGSGMAPLRSQLMHLFKTLKTTNRQISYWYGARSKNEIFYEEEFRELEKEFSNFTFHIGLSEPHPDDNWKGHTGFIHQIILDNYLKEHTNPKEIEYYMCGPAPMANAVKNLLESIGVPAEKLYSDDF